MGYMRINSDVLNKILKFNDVVKYESIEILYDGNNLINDEIISINEVDFEGFILDYSNKNNKYLLYYNYESSSILYSKNDKALREFGYEASLFLLPLSDTVLGLIGRLQDEYYERGLSKFFFERSYELYKLIGMDLNEEFIIIYNVI